MRLALRVLFTFALLSPSVSLDAQLMEYNYGWARQSGGVMYNAVGTGLTARGVNLGVAGYFSESIVLGMTSGNWTPMTSRGSTDIFVARYRHEDGGLVWVRHAGGPAADRALAIADQSAATLITGYFSGTADFTTTSVPRPITSAGARDVFVARYDGNGAIASVFRGGGSGDDEGRAIATAQNGDFVVGGVYTGNATFATPPQSVSLAAAGATDGFLLKFTAAGAIAWARSISGPGIDEVRGVAIGADGAIVITGMFTGSTKLQGGTAPSITLQGSGPSDGFTAKYDANGALVWAIRTGGVSEDVANAIAIDDIGAVTIVGSYTGPLMVRGTSGSVTLPNIGGKDGFVATYESDGRLRWAQRVSGPAEDSLVSVSIGPQRRRVVAGTARGLVEGGLPIASGLTGQIVIIQYDANGTILSRRTPLAGIGDEPRAVAVTNDGSVFATGTYRTGYLAWPMVGVATPALSALDLFVVRFEDSNSNGWFERATAGGDARGSALAQAGATVVTGGAFSRDVSFGGLRRTASGENDGIVVRYDDGVPAWSRAIGGDRDDYVSGVGLDAQGNTYVLATFAGSARIERGGADTLFDTVTAPTSPTGTPDLGMVLVKYDRAGTLVFARSICFGVGGGCRSAGLAVSPAGDVAVSGEFAGQIRFGSPAAAPLMATGNRSWVVLRFNSAGTLQWTRTAPGALYDRSSAAAMDAQGNVYVAGAFMRQLSFPAFTLTSSDLSTGFVAKFSPSGTFQWAAKTTTVPNGGYPQLMAVDPSGRVYLAGPFSGTLTMGTSSVSTPLPQTGYVARLSATGTVEWLKLIATGGAVTPTALGVDAASNLFVAGGFQGAPTFGTGTEQRQLFSEWGNGFATMQRANGKTAWLTVSNGATTNAISGTNDIAWTTGSFAQVARLGGIRLIGASPLSTYFVAKIIPFVF